MNITDGDLICDVLEGEWVLNSSLRRQGSSHSIMRKFLINLKKH
ncbi:Uncharacterised protein [Yersinia thracica]|uniref:Uncharacterized protein n=1 Tax=Yersinia thracica TaxID=2890319 RepID=A0A0T9NWJ7_9GAMM|nr:Uncharacterised protein [Yersinia thracica]